MPDGQQACEMCGSRYPSVKAALLCCDSIPNVGKTACMTAQKK